MRNFLGESATQAGSLNAPGRLRFDFNTPGAVPPAVLHDVEQQVNEVLLRRPRGARVHHLAGGGAPARRDGAVRREVRRRGAGRRGRRLRPGAVRRHARRPVRPARPGEDPVRGVDRLRRTPGRGAGRHRRVRLPGQGAPAGLPAGRAVPGARRPGRATGSSRPSPRCATRRRSWRSCAPSWCSAARRRSPTQARDCGGVAYVGTEAPEGAAGNDVRTLAQEIRGKIDPAGPAVVAVAARAGGKASLVVAVNAAAQGPRPVRGRPGQGRAVRPGRRQRRPGPGRRRAGRPGAGAAGGGRRSVAVA